MNKAVRKLPYPNWRTPLTESDLSFLGDITTQEIQERTKAFSNYGIVSNVDPLTASSPLQVTVAPNNRELSVGVGTAITPGGNIVMNKEEIKLNIPTENEEYTVFIEYDLIGIDRKLTRYNTYEPSVYNRIEDAQEFVNSSEYDVNSVVCEKGKQRTPIKIDKSANLARTELYPVERLENIVKLGTAIKTNEGSDTVVLLTLDGTGLRPWFSAHDVIHRSKLGSGLPTDSNPHGIALSDLTVGNLTLFDMMQDGGFIVSKDYMFPHYPGREVTVQVTYTLASSGITFKPVENAKKKQNGTYGTTIKPYKIGYIYAEGQPDVQFPFTYNFETGYLSIQGIDPQWSKYNIVCYVVDCLTPYNPQEMAINGIRVAAPSKYEVAITGGIALNTIQNNEISFDGNVTPMDFTCYLNEEGNVISNPGILGKFSLGDVESDEDQTFTVNNFGTAKIGIGLRTYNQANFAIEVKGILEDGSEDTDTIIIDTNSWPYTYFSSKYFVSISSWKIVQNGSNSLTVPEDSQIVFYAFRNWESRRRLAEICVVNHPGSGGGSIYYKDTRNIGFTLNPVAQFANPYPIPDGYEILALESAREMRYIHTGDILKYNTAMSPRGTYKSRMFYIPTSDPVTLTVYIEETYPNSVNGMVWETYFSPGSYLGENWFSWSGGVGGIRIGTLGLAGNQYGFLKIEGSFRNYTLAYKSNI